MAGTDYSSYLHIDELLDLQHPLTEGAHDEMLFVVIHQAYELWFKVILHELDRAVAELQAGRPQGALAPLHRTTRVDELLIAQLRVLETLTPEGFLEFRDPLAPASGLQSGQFRAIEVLGGLEGAMPADAAQLSEHDRQELHRRRGSGNLYQALCSSLRSHGFDAPEGDGTALRERRIDALAEL
jgi:tryptophan 2,3-dioxygenase